ncbi:MAG: FAD-binding oxidoreductase [Ectothiorhodospiraceae bacterium]|nr:FAD-binding oxidoreductase [Ectothiorhodospiraceae bacterium]
MPLIPELEKPSLPPSLWAATATEEPCQAPPLTGEASAEVLVIGGGYTGLSAALHLAEQGRDVLLLDAAEPGWGASGRNGGQVIPGLKDDPEAILEHYGQDVGNRIVGTVGGAADAVFDLVRRHGIACDAVQNGWIQPAHSPQALEVATARARQWERQGVDVRLLDADQVHAMIGCQPLYHGGWLDPRGGSVQPLSYARGLARVATSHGARLHGNTRVLRLQREGAEWRAVTGSGEVRARQIILATNGYTDALWPGLRRSVVSLFSQQIATAPVPEELRARLLPGRQSVSDTRKLLWYFRLDAHGRLLMGGRGEFSDRPTLEQGKPLLAPLRKLFPELTDLPLEYSWAGRVAMTRDHLPHLHVLEEGVFAGLGFNGRGVAMGTVMGRLLAELAGGRPPEEMPYPVTPLKPIPFHGLHRPVTRMLIHYYKIFS